jgi:hypothetical protein
MPTATLLLAYAHLRKQLAPIGVACALFVVAATFAGAAFSLGEGAEELVEHLPGISEHTIEEHEEAADIALVLSIVTGVVALGTAALKARGSRLLKLALTSLFISGAISSISLSYTSYEGGKIRHPEAYSPAPPNGGDDHDD